MHQVIAAVFVVVSAISDTLHPCNKQARKQLTDGLTEQQKADQPTDGLTDRRLSY